MAFSAGVFSRLYNWVTDAAASVKIRADRMDAEMDGMATGLSTCVLKDGSQIITANIPMGGFKFTGSGSSSTPNARTDVPTGVQLQDGTFTYIADTGSANTYVGTMVPTVTAYTAGMAVRLRIATTNTGASTLNLNGVSATAIVRRDGSALLAGDLPAGCIAELFYDGTSTNWELQGVGNVSGIRISTQTSNTILGVADLGTVVDITTPFAAQTVT